MKNVFDRTDVDETIVRIHQLNKDSQRLWGKMTVDQMLAHCNVTYELVYDNKHPKPNAFLKFFLKMFAKETVCGSRPYQKSLKTAPMFIIEGAKDFDAERKRLIDYINKTQQLGASHFEGKESHSFGVLTIEEWNTMFYKHLDHHLKQFGV
jgi:hypothetical protein